MASGQRRLVWLRGRLWWRSYREGGFDGYRTLGERVPCGTMEQMVRHGARSFAELDRMVPR